MAHDEATNEATNDTTSDTPKHSDKKQDPQATDEAPERAQPELTEQNLVSEKLREEDDPRDKRGLEHELEDMGDDIKDANSR